MEPTNHPWKERNMVFQTSRIMFQLLIFRGVKDLGYKGSKLCRGDLDDFLMSHESHVTWTSDFVALDCTLLETNKTCIYIYIFEKQYIYIYIHMYCPYIWNQPIVDYGGFVFGGDYRCLPFFLVVWPSRCMLRLSYWISVLHLPCAMQACMLPYYGYSISF